MAELGWCPDGKSEWQKCVYLLQMVHEAVDYGLPDCHAAASGELLRMWHARRHKTSCGYISMVLVDVLNTVGIPCRQVAGWAVEPLPGRTYSHLPAEISINHLMCEAWVEDRWVLLDPTDGGWYEDDDGRLLSALDIQLGLRAGRSHSWRAVGAARDVRLGYPGLCGFLAFPAGVGLIVYGQRELKHFALAGWYLAMRRDPYLLVRSLGGTWANAAWRMLVMSMSVMSLAALLAVAGLAVAAGIVAL